MTLEQLVKKHRDVEKVARAVERNPQVWYDVVDNPVRLRRMLGQLVRDLIHDERRITRVPETPEKRAKRQDGQRRTEGNFRNTLLLWPVYGGKLLKDCTRDDLARSVEHRRSMIESHGQSVAFEARVLQGMPKNGKKTVGDVFGPAQLQRMYSEAVE